MLEPVICPKCRTLSYVDYSNMKRNNTLIKCSHFSAVIRQYESDKAQAQRNIEALKRLAKEQDEEDRQMEEAIEIQFNPPHPFDFPEFKFDENGNYVSSIDESVRPDHFRSMSDPVWNCRCFAERSNMGYFGYNGVKSLGYAVVPHVTVAVKGFLYGFK